MLWSNIVGENLGPNMRPNIGLAAARLAAMAPAHIYTVSQKNIPNIINCNLKKNYQILKVFGMNIPDTNGHRMTVHVPA